LPPVPIDASPADHRGKASTVKAAFKVPGIRLDLGHLDAAEAIHPVHPVVVEELATDQVPLVDDRAVDLEHDQQPVCRIGGPEAGEVPGQRQHPVLTSGHRREPYRRTLNER
jgi:hypothetical protein